MPCILDFATMNVMCKLLGYLWKQALYKKDFFFHLSEQVHNVYIKKCEYIWMTVGNLFIFPFLWRESELFGGIKITASREYERIDVASYVASSRRKLDARQPNLHFFFYGWSLGEVCTVNSSPRTPARPRHRLIWEINLDAAYFVSVTRRVSGRFRAKMLLVIACSARHLLCRTVVPNKDGWRLRNGRPFISDFSPLIFSSSFSLSLVPISFSFF